MGGALCEREGSPHATSDPTESVAATEDKGADMGFVQIIDFATSRYDDLRKVEDEWTVISLPAMSG